MKIRLHPIVQFLLFLSICLTLSFLAHTYILAVKGLPKYDNLIVKSYVVNAFLAAAIYISLYILQKRLKNQIGFLFMGGSFLKFIFFFIIFYPEYSADDDMNKVEFSAFFVPYAISLIVETVFMAKMLKKMD